jgi:hypothetical protein
VPTPPLTWCDALEAEYRALYGVPALDDAAAPTDPAARLQAVQQRMHERGPSAVCLSGGGIRSAVFALGVLQGLAHLGALARIDYLSTVSGGGYIGGWLTAWLHRQGPSGRERVLHTLDPIHTPEIEAVTPVDRVRSASRYLALRGGVFSADVWTLVTTLARNLLLNWMVILPLLAAALLIPRVYYGLVFTFESPLDATAACTPPVTSLVFLGVLAVSFATTTAYVVLSFTGRVGDWGDRRFLGWFLTPLLIGAIALTLFWASYPCNLDLWQLVVPSAVIPAIGWLVLANVGRRLWRAAPDSDGSALRLQRGGWAAFGALLASPILALGVYWLGNYPYGFGAGEPAREFFAAFAVPAVLALVLAQMMVFVGLASHALDDAALEWWARAGAWVAIAMAVWIASSLLVFYVADWIDAGIHAVSRWLAVDHRKTSAVFGALVPLLSSLAGMAMRNRDSNGAGGGGSTVSRMIDTVALPLVILILLSSIAWANFRLVQDIELHSPVTHPPGAGLGDILAFGAALIVIALTMSRFVPVNRFSLNGMYRDRLVRTFLGASHEHRHPNAFTGFDGRDDLCVHELRDVRPLHVINATLNAVSSTDIGRHEQHSQSFTFSPLHIGTRNLGYRPADQYGSDRGAPGSGLSLGMALAVSGAAASSALGRYSSHARAFLLTLANARLGVWFGNPRDDGTWRLSEPPLGISPIMRELLGLTTDHNPYVYLSDGGHYENLGLWEMVARRCRLVVISDASCDPHYTFDDLSNAVRRIRLDLGVPILFPALPMTREGQGHTNPHAALGAIRYSAVDGPDAPDGTIVYIKATLSGDEPVDVRNFAATDPAFPHDSTSDQFFDEARFESYRTLGFHSVLTSAEALASAQRGTGTDTVSTLIAEPARR